MEFIIGMVILLADIWAIVNIIQAPGPSTGRESFVDPADLFSTRNWSRHLAGSRSSSFQGKRGMMRLTKDGFGEGLVGKKE